MRGGDSMRKDMLEKINPFVKAIAMILCCAILAATKSWRVNVSVLVGAFIMMIFFSRCSLKQLAGIFIPIVFISITVFISGLAYGDPEAASGSLYQVTSVYSALLLSTRILAYVSLGLLFALTMDPTEFVMSLMHQGRLKPKFAYGVLAAFNLIPTLRREWDEVVLAYHVRQKKTGIIPFGPLFNTLVNGIRWSENVAMAMESKGFDGESKRTYAMVTKIRPADILFAAGCGIFMIANIFILV